jgi:hypothetical protein
MPHELKSKNAKAHIYKKKKKRKEEEAKAHILDKELDSLW